MSSHDHGMGSSATGQGPSLHFTPGDTLYFSAWAPTSPGAIVGACIGLFLLAIFERWFAALRSVFELHWKHRALLLSSRYSAGSGGSDPSRSNSRSEDSSDIMDAKELGSVEKDKPIPSIIPRYRARTIPPFVPSQDFPRGIMFAFQACLRYLLMLAVMTFQAGFIITIIVGLGVGEVLFGRVTLGSAH